MDINKQWVRFDGNMAHCSLPFHGGTRYSLLFDTQASYAAANLPDRRFLTTELGFHWPPVNGANDGEDGQFSPAGSWDSSAAIRYGKTYAPQDERLAEGRAGLRYWHACQRHGLTYEYPTPAEPGGRAEFPNLQGWDGTGGSSEAAAAASSDDGGGDDGINGSNISSSGSSGGGATAEAGWRRHARGGQAKREDSEQEHPLSATSATVFVQGEKYQCTGCFRMVAAPKSCDEFVCPHDYCAHLVVGAFVSCDSNSRRSALCYA